MTVKPVKYIVLGYMAGTQKRKIRKTDENVVSSKSNKLVVIKNLINAGSRYVSSAFCIFFISLNIYIILMERIF